jgi:hypothetical protein
MVPLSSEEKYEAYIELLEARLNRQLVDDEQAEIRRLAYSDIENFHIYRNLFEELGSERVDN